MQIVHTRLQLLSRMFPGGIGPPALEAVQMLVEPLRPVRDTEHFFKTNTTAGNVLLILHWKVVWVL